MVLRDLTLKEGHVDPYRFGTVHPFRCYYQQQPVLVLQRELWVTLKHTIRQLERGSAVS